MPKLGDLEKSLVIGITKASSSNTFAYYSIGICNAPYMSNANLSAANKSS